ncbi:MAG: RNA 3'-terminal phosphate cyclase, partial [Planctomycetota bacterium]
MGDSDLIEIDGQLGEGGGQVLRSAVGLSCVTQQPVRVVNIRAKRKQPGLRPQHVASIEAAATISDAETSNVAVGSDRIEFRPRAVKPGDYSFDIGTAGSTGLVL